MGYTGRTYGNLPYGDTTGYANRVKLNCIENDIEVLKPTVLVRYQVFLHCLEMAYEHPSIYVKTTEIILSKYLPKHFLKGASI